MATIASDEVGELVADGCGVVVAARGDADQTAILPMASVLMRMASDAFELVAVRAPANANAFEFRVLKEGFEIHIRSARGCELPTNSRRARTAAARLQRA